LACFLFRKVSSGSGVAGILKLTIIEGKINKLSSNNKNLYLNNLFSDKSESYLNIRNLEQGTDQINRLEGYQSTIIVSFKIPWLVFCLGR
jgi:hemolysin activation/secretion protein